MLFLLENERAEEEEQLEYLTNNGAGNHYLIDSKNDLAFILIRMADIKSRVCCVLKLFIIP